MHANDFARENSLYREFDMSVDRLAYLLNDRCSAKRHTIFRLANFLDLKMSYPTVYIVIFWVF